MKILKMIGLVLAVHVVAFVLVALPACRSTARTSPSSSPRATDPNQSRIDAARAQTPLSQNGGSAQQAPADAYAPPAPVSTTPYTTESVSDFGMAASAPAPAPIPAQPVATAKPTRPADTAGDSQVQVIPAITYTVVKGDSPWTIAKKHGISTSALLSANNLTSKSTLQIGQKLIVPAKPLSKTSGSAATQTGLIAEGTTVYKVKANDTLGEIAIRFGTTPERLKALNKLTGTVIRVDQELLVPGAPEVQTTFGASSGVAPAPAPAATAAVRADGGVTITHVVRPGETIGGIAKKYGASLQEIIATNNIADTRKIREGQKLVITSAKKNLPAGTAPAAPAPAPAAPATVTQPVEDSAISTYGVEPPPPIGPTSTSGTEAPISGTPISPDFAPPVNPVQEPAPIGVPQN